MDHVSNRPLSVYCISTSQMLKGAVEKIDESLPTYLTEVEDMKKQLKSYNEEIGTPLDTALTAAETRTLQEIEADIPRLNKEIKAAKQALSSKKDERYVDGSISKQCEWEHFPGATAKRISLMITGGS